MVEIEFEDRLRDRSRWKIGDACSLTKVLDLLSTKTAFLIIRECFYGTSRFEDFVERIGASAPSVSRALKQLEAAEIVMRVPYQEPGKRVQDEYRLTEAGQDLFPALLSLVHWGDKHLQGGSGPLTFFDADSGRPLRVDIATETADPPARPENIELRLNTHLRRRSSTASRPRRK